MPDFPRYDSERSLTTQQPRAIRDDADIQDSAGKLTKQTTNSLATFQEGLVKYQQFTEKVQQDTALYNYKIGAMEISNQAVQDTNIQNESKYQKQLADLQKNSVKGISSERVKNGIAAELNYLNTVSAIGIRTEFMKKNVLHGQAVKTGELELAAQSGNVAAVESITKEAIKDNIWDELSAEEKRIKYTSKAKMNMFTQDYNIDISKTEENLAKNTYGFNMKELEAAHQILEKETKMIQMQNQNTLLTEYVNKQDIDISIVKDKMNKKQITPGFAEALIKKINNPKPDKVSRDVEFIALQNKSMKLMEKLDKASPNEILSHMTEIMQAHELGLVDKSDVDRAVKELNPLLDNQFKKMAIDVLEKSNPKTWQEHIQFWIDSNFTDKYSDKRNTIQARMYRKMLDASIAGKDLDAELVNVMNYELDLQLADNKAAPDRQFATNPENNQRIYSDDGGLTWFDSKTGKEVK